MKKKDKQATRDLFGQLKELDLPKEANPLLSELERMFGELRRDASSEKRRFEEVQRNLEATKVELANTASLKRELSQAVREAESSRQREQQLLVPPSRRPA